MNTPTPLVKRNIPAQFGTSAEADFEQNTWTFEMPETFEVYAGEFAIVDKEQYLTAVNYHDRMVECLKQFVDNGVAVGSDNFHSELLLHNTAQQLLTEIKESK